MNRKFSDEDKRLAVKAAEKLGTSEAARMFGCSPQSLRYWRKVKLGGSSVAAIGCPNKYTEAFREKVAQGYYKYGKRIAKVARAYGVDSDTVRRCVRDYPQFENDIENKQEAQQDSYDEKNTPTYTVLVAIRKEFQDLTEIVDGLCEKIDSLTSELNQTRLSQTDLKTAVELAVEKLLEDKEKKGKDFDSEADSQLYEYWKEGFEKAGI